jgi:glycosyltransferase involved in cell wall biosynthesis
LALDDPAVSVVVATRDRASRLADLLESLRSQTLPGERFEVIVVDDGSRDGTAELLAGVGNAGIRVVTRSSGGGPSAARNDGWRVARAPLVAFTDDDCVATPGWLAALVDASAARPGAIVQGRTDPIPAERDRLGPFSRSLWVDGGPYYQTCNIAYPRELLERLGGFDADAFPFVGEDTDLAWRAIEAGASVYFEPAAHVHHAVARLGPLGALRFAFRWTDSIQLFARHPALRGPHLTKRVFWKGSHYLLVRALLTLLVPRRMWPLAVWLWLPYALHLVERGRVDGGGPALAPWFVLHDLVELAAVARGAVRYRTPVL